MFTVVDLTTHSVGILAIGDLVSMIRQPTMDLILLEVMKKGRFL